MSDNSDQPNYEEYWSPPTFSALGVDQGYIIEEKIVTAEELLKRFSGFEPFELALGINNKIIASKSGSIYSFPKPFLLCKTRHDKPNDRMLYFLLEADRVFPFRYTWTDDTLSFDFTGIVFKESDINTVELCAVEHDFQLSRHDESPKPYVRLAFLLENFPVDGPQNLIEALTRNVVEPLPVAAENVAAPSPVAPEDGKPKKDMTKANEKRREKTETRWKEQFSVGIATAVFCFEHYQKTGKPVIRDDYEAALIERGYAPLMIEADTIFRKLMPPEVLHRGD